MSQNTPTSNTQPQAPVTPATQSRPLLVRLAPWISIAAVLGMIAYATSDWNAWVGNRSVQTTDNAYVRNDLAVLSAKVNGDVAKVAVQDFQPVRAGELILQIDDRDYRIQVAQAEAELLRARSVLEQLDRELALQRAAIAQAEANHRVSEARYAQYRQDLTRQSGLAAQGYASQQKLEAVKAEFDAAAATRQSTAALVASARRQLEVQEGLRAQRQADVDAAQASLDRANLELSFTRIIAPFDGTVNRIQLKPGSLVSQGTQVTTIVPSTAPYVIANYKETQLRRVREGMPVEITVDALGDRKFVGHVERVAPASLAAGSLVSSESASGNFTKVIQRIALRIDLDADQDGIELLRPGMSVETQIDTGAQPTSKAVQVGAGKEVSKQG